MILKKGIVLRFFVLIFIGISILSGCGGNNICPEKALNNFSELIKSENFDDLKLTIVYMRPWVLTPMLTSVERLISDNLSYKIVVDSVDLKEHVNLLKQVSSDVLTSVAYESDIDARVHYIFETNGGYRLFDVTMWGWNEYSTIFVNGVEFEGHNIFYEIIIPFLPDDVVDFLEKQRTREWLNYREDYSS